jgi:hypothetical protein
VYETEHDVQRGFLVGFTYKTISLTTYVFNPGAGQPTVVVALGAHF